MRNTAVRIQFFREIIQHSHKLQRKWKEKAGVKGDEARDKRKGNEKKKKKKNKKRKPPFNQTKRANVS